MPSNPESVSDAAPTRGRRVALLFAILIILAAAGAAIWALLTWGPGTLTMDAS